MQRNGWMVVVVMVTGLVLAASAAAQPGEKLTQDGKVTKVTLYRGQAQVTRVVEVERGTGTLELVVTGLPNQVRSDSLFAEGSGGIDVRAVRYRERVVGEEPRQEVRALEEQIQKLSDDLELNRRMQQLVAKRVEYLDKMDAAITARATAEAAKGELNAGAAEALENMTRFAFDSRERVTRESVELSVQQRTIEQQINTARRKYQQLTAGASRSVKEAVVFVEKRGNGKEQVRVTYLVDQCGWQPTYNFRASSKDGAVRVEYNALIQQMSGEDWSQVELTLSTASPALSAASPALAPFRVVLDPVSGKPTGPSTAEVSRKLSQYAEQQRIYIGNQNTTYNLGANFDNNWAWNGAANSLQVTELNVRGEALDLLRGEKAVTVEEPSISYPLEQRVSLASRSDQQIIRIVQTDLRSKMYHVAIPVLSTYVYREAQLENTSGRDLLGGPIAVFLDGRFVGRAEIKTVARGQKFVLGLGADTQLRCSRELVDRDEKVQGGNQVQQFEYRLVIENYKDEDVHVRLFDRTPRTPNKNDLRVTLTETSAELSEDAVYVRRERPDGILRWDLTVPGGASGEEAKTVAFTFTLEFDRNFALANPTGSVAQELQEHFMRRQNDMFYAQ